MLEVFVVGVILGLIIFILVDIVIPNKKNSNNTRSECKDDKDNLQDDEKQEAMLQEWLEFCEDENQSVNDKIAFLDQLLKRGYDGRI